MAYDELSETDLALGTGTDNGSKSLLLMTVKGDQTVVFFDEDTGDKLAAPIVGTPMAKPHEIILSSNAKRAFVTLYGDAGYPENKPHNQIAVLDVASMELEKLISTNLYFGPHGLARDGKGRIWVTAENNECLLVIDPDSCEITNVVYSETHCHFLHSSPNGKIIFSSHKEIPYVGLFDTEKLRMIDKIQLPIGSQAIYHDPYKDVLYVGDFYRPLIHIIDTKLRKVVQEIPVKGVPGWPYVTPDGRYLAVSTYIESDDQGFVEVFDSQTYESISIAELPTEPFHLLACEDNETLLIVLGNGLLLRMKIATADIDSLHYDAGTTMPEQVVRVKI